MAETQPVAPQRGNRQVVQPGMTKQRRQAIFLMQYPQSDYDAAAACEVIGISYGTFRNWMRESGFRDQLEARRALMNEKNRGQAFRMAHGKAEGQEGKPDGAMLRFLMERLDPEMRRTTNVKVTGEVNHLHRAVLSGMSVEDKERELRAVLSDDEVSALEQDIVEAEWEEAGSELGVVAED